MSQPVYGPTVPVEELPAFQQPVLYGAARARALREHVKLSHKWVRSYDAPTDSYERHSVPRRTPICARCKEPWGLWGCTTATAIAALGLKEVQLRASERTRADLAEALSPRFGVELLREPGNHQVGLTLRVDEFTLLHGQFDVIDAVLAKVRHHWRKWLKDVGDKNRLALDHRESLLRDSERYVYLSQEFDPSKPIINKRRGLPWD